MQRVAATKPIPVRIAEEILPRLDHVAERLGTNRAALIAFCAKTFLEDFERHGESMMPMDWKNILDRLDGRTKEARESGPPEMRASHGRRARYPSAEAGGFELNEKGLAKKPQSKAAAERAKAVVAAEKLVKQKG